MRVSREFNTIFSGASSKKKKKMKRKSATNSRPCDLIYFTNLGKRSTLNARADLTLVKRTTNKDFTVGKDYPWQSLCRDAASIPKRSIHT